MPFFKKRLSTIELKVSLVYFISYIIIITLLFVTIGGFSYHNLIKEKKEVASDEINTYLTRKTQSMDEKIGDAMSVSLSFHQNREIAKIRKLSYRFRPFEYSRFETVASMLKPYTTNEYVEKISIYFHGNELLLASNLIDARPWVYFNIEFRSIFPSYELFREDTMSRDPGEYYLIHAPVKGQVIIAQKLPYSDTINGATVFSTVNVSQMLSIDDIFGRNKNTRILLMDENGEVLYQNTNESEITAAAVEEYIAGRAISDQVEHYMREADMFGLTLHMFVDKQELYEETALLPQKLVLIYALFLLVSVGLAFLFSSGMSKPMSALMRIAGTNNEEKKYPIWHLVDGSEVRKAVERVSDISINNIQLSSKIRGYQQGIRNDFLRKLLNGEGISGEEVRLIQSDMTEFFSFEKYTVALMGLLRLEDTQEDSWAVSGALISLYNYLEQYRAADLYYCPNYYNRAALILCGDIVDSKEEICKVLSEISVHLLETGYKACWAVGRPVSNIDQIFISNQHALRTLEAIDMINADKYVWFVEGETTSLEMNYTLEDEQRLFLSLTQGNAKASKAIIDELFERNAGVMKGSRNRMWMFVSALSNTVYRAEDSVMELSDENKEELNLFLWQMKNIEDIDIHKRYMYFIIDLFANIVKSRSANRYNKLLTRIYTLIQDNYSDTELCLSMIAEKLSLTESYISTFFKQYSGKNISQYIEAVRMQKAKELLLSGNMSTAQISVDVGYSNTNTFYKAFKRHFGINPKAYKEKELNENQNSDESNEESR